MRESGDEELIFESLKNVKYGRTYIKLTRSNGPFTKIVIRIWLPCRRLGDEPSFRPSFFLTNYFLHGRSA